MGYELVIGAGIISFLLLYFASLIDPKNHAAFRLLLIGLAVVLFIPIGKGIIDSSSVCTSVINSTTLNAVTNVTAYTYTTHCYDVTTSTTHNVVFKVVSWLLSLFLMYVLIYFMYDIFTTRLGKIFRNLQAWRKSRKRK